MSEDTGRVMKNTGEGVGVGVEIGQTHSQVGEEGDSLVRHHLLHCHFKTYRQSDREKQTVRQRETDSQTDRNRQSDRDKQTVRQRETDSQTERNRQSDREKQTVRERETDSQTERNRQTDRETDSQTERNRQKT